METINPPRTTTPAPPRLACVATSYSHASEELLHSLRHHARSLLQSWKVADGTTEDVVSAVSELYTNVLRYTYRPHACAVELRLNLSVIELRVTDYNPTRPEIPADPVAVLMERLEKEQGRGLCMIALTAKSLRFVPLPGSAGAIGKVAVVQWAMA